MQLKLSPKFFIFIVIFLTVGNSSLLIVEANQIDDLEDQIEIKSEQIKEIQKDINKYQVQLTDIRAEKQTLQSVIDELDVSRQNVNANIDLTQIEIDTALYDIEKLGLQIKEKQFEIDLNTTVIAETIRNIYKSENQSFVETFLGYDNLSDFWSELDNLERFQIVIQQDLKELYDLQNELQLTKNNLQEKNHELSQLQNTLVGQRAVIDANKAQKDDLLDATKSEESTYQILLAEKIRQREIFERELSQIENELRINIDPNSIPSSGSGVLAWPLENILITQYFGNTPFASANPQVYSGGGHNGVDFGISSGSQVKSALSGIVAGTGNTDLQPGCFSYGKWILIKHNNGLSSLYAHLSHISVNKGDFVQTGDVIGFSGNTGYSTGPHLHFSVFASDGVQIIRLGEVKAVTNCGNMEIPIAPQEAYLNPLSYL